MSKQKVAKRKVAMCVMAHPDDCEILAGGTLALLAKKGWAIHVVTMTAGDGGSSVLGPCEIGDIRRKEGAAGAKILGGKYYCMECSDLYVTYEPVILRKMFNLTRQIVPTLILTHSPSDYMIDHEETSRIARAASFTLGVNNVSNGPVPKHPSVPHLYYADPVEGIDIYGQDVLPSTYVNISSVMATKAKALKAHDSQRQWLREHHGMDQYIASMQHWSGIRGKQMGDKIKYGEGFRQHMGHPYPKDCILKKQLTTLVQKVSKGN